MPSVEITDAQARALARGENVSLTPKPPEAKVRTYIVTYLPNGVAWLAKTRQELPREIEGSRKIVCTEPPTCIYAPKDNAWKVGANHHGSKVMSAYGSTVVAVEVQP